MSQRRALDFGDSGITRLYCDRCSKQILVCYKRTLNDPGDYCSKRCLKESTNQPPIPAPMIVLENLKNKQVKTLAGPRKVKLQPRKVKLDQPPAPAQTSQLSPRGLRQVARRDAILNLYMASHQPGHHREPSLGEVETYLRAKALGASIRTVWKDLIFCRAAQSGLSPDRK